MRPTSEVWEADRGEAGPGCGRIARTRSRGRSEEPGVAGLDRRRPGLNGQDFWLRDDRATRRATPAMIDSVVLAERLREVNALIGFTRIQPPGESEPWNAVRCDGRRWQRWSPRWVPATEVRGEGIFLRFDPRAYRRLAGRERGRVIASRSSRCSSFVARCAEAGALDAASPASSTSLLHSLSHALMREFALECGYNAASIRERIYASPGGSGTRMAAS